MFRPASALRAALLACASCSHAVVPPASVGLHQTAAPLGQGRIEASAFVGAVGHQLDGATGGGPRFRWGVADRAEVSIEGYVAEVDHDVAVLRDDGSEDPRARAWAARAGARISTSDWLAVLGGLGLGDAPTATFAAADGAVVLSPPRPWVGYLWPYVGGRGTVSAPMGARPVQIGGFVQEAGPTAWLGAVLGLRVGPGASWYVSGEVGLAEAFAHPTRWADAAAHETEPGESDWVADGAHTFSFSAGLVLR